MTTRVLVLGATGYVGGRLVPRLLDAGCEVRCLVRDPDKVTGAVWAGRAEAVRGDLLEPSTIAGAFDDVDVVFHLVHSMGSSAQFADADRRIAATVAEEAARAGVRRIVYLGGLGEVDAQSSAHLRSRAEVGDILQAGPVPATVLRAAVIIGSGSASFEMLRHLVEKLPVMVTPRWVRNRVQPIAIRDVLRYLLGVMEDDGDDHVYDIGGPDVLTYLEMMRVYAQVAGLPKRLVLVVPFLTPRLSSHWTGLVTPVPVGVAKPLVESLVQEVVVRAPADGQDGPEDVTDVVPGPCLSYEESLRLALRRVRDRAVETSWREAALVGRSPAEPHPDDPDWAGGTLLTDDRSTVVHAPAERAFATVCGVGGERGWPAHQWAWSIRGAVDHLIGGVGLRRGRRDPDDLRVGDALDFWRVEAVRRQDDGCLLRLRAEMRLPGNAWLEWRVSDDGDGLSTLRQRALFAPRGLAGRLYWWVLVPFHGLVFGATLRNLAATAASGGHPDSGGAVVTSTDAQTARPGGRVAEAARRVRRRRRVRRG